MRNRSNRSIVSRYYRWRIHGASISALGSGCFPDVAAAVSQQSPETVEFNEEWFVIEGESLSYEETIDELFIIQYSLPTVSSLQDYETFNYNFNIEPLNDDPWSWSSNWDLIDWSGTDGRGGEGWGYYPLTVANPTPGEQKWYYTQHVGNHTHSTDVSPFLGPAPTADHQPPYVDLLKIMRIK